MRGRSQIIMADALRQCSPRRITWPRRGFLRRRLNPVRRNFGGEERLKNINTLIISNFVYLAAPPDLVWWSAGFSIIGVKAGA